MCPILPAPLLLDIRIDSITLLAHQSRRLIDELICSIDRHPTLVNIFKHLLRGHWANWSQILCGASMGWGAKVPSNGLGHMAKVAAMPIYGNLLKNRTSDILKLGYQHRVFEYYQIPSNDDPRLTFLRKGQFWFLVHLWITQKLLKSMISKLVYIVK